MSKSILLSIKPEWVAKILNGEKTIEVRKKFPKDYVGWVYLYCSKDKKFPLVLASDGESLQVYENAKYYPPFIRGGVLNGKVVARFWCDMVDEIGNCSIDVSYTHYTGNIYSEKEVCEGACLNWKDLGKYLKGKNGYAIHISDLEIFDMPRELSEFNRYHEKKDEYSACWTCKRFGTGCMSCRLTKAPQNFCYVEGDELLKEVLK